jgi:hypothetical protein
MQLRIIDQYQADPHQQSVDIILQTDSQQLSFRVYEFKSPLTANFHQALTWYFQHYSQSLEQTPEDKRVPEKLISFGQYLADCLLGEDMQLVQVKDLVEEEGYDQLHVQIESSRLAFFADSWEIMVLPDAKYVLSTVSQGFIRRLTGPDQPDYEAELNYDLATKTTDTNESTSTTRLGILHILARPNQQDSPPALACQASLASLRWPDALHYELWLSADIAALGQRLADKTRPLHIIHYDGPIDLLDKQPQLYLGGMIDPAQSIPVSTLAALLAENSVALCSVDGWAYRNEEQQALRTDLGLAQVAHVMATAGVTNVIGLSHLTDPWTRHNCFQRIYERLLTGLTLSQAVVEVRKQLQSQLEIPYFHIKPVAFHSWPLPIHYGGQPLSFFSQPQLNHELSQSPAYQAIRQRLFGFHQELLPPQVESVDDGTLLNLLAMLHKESATGCCIKANPGMGKTYLAHQGAMYWLQQQQADYGFYFDLTTGFYSKTDILQMIAPVFDKVDDPDGLLKALQSQRCYFVFEALHHRSVQTSQASAEGINELQAFLTWLLEQGHKLVITSEPDDDLLISCQTLDIAPLTPLAQRVMGVKALRHSQQTSRSQPSSEEQQSEPLDKQLAELLPGLQGQAFLIAKVVPQLVRQSPKQITDGLTKWSVTKTNNAVRAYYQWQWATLPPVWQRLLLLISDLPVVLLEMLMLACDPAPANQDKHDKKGKSGQLSATRLFQPAVQLFAQFGTALTVEGPRISEGIATWEQAGLLLPQPQGTLLEPAFLAFVKSIREQDDWFSQQGGDTAVLVSQVLCEGLRRVAQHLVAQPNQTLSHYLLANRRHWARHFEKLWFAKKYLSFMQVKSAFDRLLQSAGLAAESAAWSLDLLKRSEQITADTDNIESAVAWLTLAISALACPDSRAQSLFSEAADDWQAWLDTFDIEAETNHRAWFQPAVLFLHSLYQQRKQWQACRRVNEIAYEIYHCHQAWPQLIQTLKQLAFCSFALKDNEQGLAYENTLLHEPPFNKLPAHIKPQLLMEVAQARVNRGDTEQATPLLAELRQSPMAKQLEPLLDTLQADIDQQEERYADALRTYWRLWQSTASQAGMVNKQGIKDQLIKLAKQVGSKDFKTLSSEVLGEVIDPKTLVVANQTPDTAAARPN